MCVSLAHFSSQRASLQLWEDDYYIQARTIAPQDTVAQGTHHRIPPQCRGHCVYQLVPRSCSLALILKGGHSLHPPTDTQKGSSWTRASSTLLSYPLEYVPPCSCCSHFCWSSLPWHGAHVLYVVCIQMVVTRSTPSLLFICSVPQNAHWDLDARPILSALP